MRKVSAAVMVALLSSGVLGGCARDMNANTYTSDAAVGKVLEGTVLTATPVTIKNSDKLQDNTMGMLGGGVVGGLAGSGVGKGTGQSLAIAGGALAGAALGSVIQDKLGTNKGMQYVVRIDSKYVDHSRGPKVTRNVKFGDGSVDQDIKDSIAVQDTKTDLLSVVQGNDVIFQPGQRVLIVYNNDRPRLVASH